MDARETQVGLGGKKRKSDVVLNDGTDNHEVEALDIWSSVAADPPLPGLRRAYAAAFGGLWQTMKRCINRAHRLSAQARRK